MYCICTIAEEPEEVSKMLPGLCDWCWPQQAILSTNPNPKSGYLHTCNLLWLGSYTRPSMLFYTHDISCKGFWAF